MSDPKNIRSAIQCTYCGDEIEKVYRHDYQQCRCERLAVDGGKAYQKRVTDGYYVELTAFENEGK